MLQNTKKEIKQNIGAKQSYNSTQLSLNPKLVEINYKNHFPSFCLIIFCERCWDVKFFLATSSHTYVKSPYIYLSLNLCCICENHVGHPFLNLSSIDTTPPFFFNKWFYFLFYLFSLIHIYLNIPISITHLTHIFSNCQTFYIIKHN